MARTQTTLRVKNGTITLPGELRRAWKAARVFVRIYKDRAVIEGPRPQIHSSRAEAWKKAAGIWKDKAIPDPVKWQRSIRREWERNLPKLSKRSSVHS